MTGITFIRLEDKYYTTRSKYLVDVEKVVDGEKNKYRRKYTRPFLVIKEEIITYEREQKKKKLLKFGKLQYFGK